jgi:type II secretory pathway pseudopilin PulG
MEISKMKQNQAQQGFSLLGLVFVIAVVFGVGVIGMKSFPVFTEYRAIQKAIVKAKGAGSTPQEIASSFNKAAQIDDISTITGSDLAIEKGKGGEMEVSFDYAKEVELVAPVSLLFRFKGSTKK